MIARDEIDREELRFDPFFKDVLMFLSTSTLIDMLKDLHEMIPEKDWEVLGAYHAVKDRLIDRGCSVSVEREQVVVTGPEVQIPF
jgi:hypothetical protein